MYSWKKKKQRKLRLRSNCFITWTDPEEKLKNPFWVVEVHIPVKWLFPSKSNTQITINNTKEHFLPQIKSEQSSHCGLQGELQT